VSTWLRPQTLEEALAALKNSAGTDSDRLTIVAGATDFYPAATTRQAWFQPTPQHALDISAIHELRGITTTPDGWRLGALATWSDVVSTHLPSAFDSLKQAARQVGGVQIQNRGTIAGNICNASPAADGAPPLMAMDAIVEISSFGAGSVQARRVPLSAFILGNRKTVLEPHEMVSAIVVPSPPADERAVFLKLGARAYLVISIASVAAHISLDAAGHIRSARIAVGACSAVPQRLTRLEQRLVGASADSAFASASDLVDLSPIDDVRATADYRRSAALTLVNRALGDLTVSERSAA
jgi:CO/xanthine dehydrogenase FAD-binding subunit